jgi:hypothetical protein
MMLFTHSACEHPHCAVQYFDRPSQLTKITKNGAITHEAPRHVRMIFKSLHSYLDNMFQERSSLKKPARLPKYISKMSIDVNDIRMIVVIVLQQ